MSRISGAEKEALCGASLAAIGGSAGLITAGAGAIVGVLAGWHALAISLIAGGSVGCAACFGTGIGLMVHGFNRPLEDD